MQLFEILLIISLIVVASSLFVYFIFKKEGFLRKCTIIFYFNTAEKTFRISKTSPSWIFHYFFIKKSILNFTKSYYSIQYVDKLFNNQTIAKNIRNAFLQLDIHKKQEHVFKTTIFKRKDKYNLSFKFVMTENNKGIGALNIDKKSKYGITININNNFNSLSKYITNSMFSRMYAIKIDKHIFDDFLKLVSKEIIKKISCSTFFCKHDGILYLVIYSKRQNVLKKVHKTILKHLFKWNKINNATNICWLSFLSIHKGVLTKSMINNNKIKLDFYMYKLIKYTKPNQEKINVFNLNFDNDDYNDYDEFVEFKSVLTTLNDSIKSDNVGGLVRKIYNVDTKKVSGKYVFPYINDIVPKKYKEIIDIKQIKNKLTNSLAYKASTIETNMFPRGAIIELNDVWLQKNYSKIINTSYLYCICIDSKESINSIRQILSFLSKNKKVKYGLKITKNLQADNTIFDGLDLSFIVVSEHISSKANHRLEFSVILLINNFFKNTETKIIYVNPTPKLDYVQRKKLNIQYVVKG